MNTPNLDRALQRMYVHNGVESSRWNGLKKTPALRSRVVAALFAWANPFNHALLQHQHLAYLSRCAKQSVEISKLQNKVAAMEKLLKDDMFMNMKKYEERKLFEALHEEYIKFVNADRGMRSATTFDDFRDYRASMGVGDTAAAFEEFLKQTRGPDIRVRVDPRDDVLRVYYTFPKMQYAWLVSQLTLDRQR